MRSTIRRPLLTILLTAVAAACDPSETDPDAGASEPGLDAGPPVEETRIVLGFASVYDGAEVCVAETCGTIGEVDELVVRPPVIGTRMVVEVSRGDARETFETDWTLDFQVIEVDPATARTASVSVGLYANGDGSCGLYVTSHHVGATVITSGPPPAVSATSTACGAFAD